MVAIVALVVDLVIISIIIIVELDGEIHLHQALGAWQKGDTGDK